jgi:mRNA interferase MazF
MVTPGQGDIYWVKFGHSGDSGPYGIRPAVIIQNDLLNKSKIQTTVVALLTSNIKLARIPGNIRLKKGVANLPKPSVVVVSQIATVAKSRLLEKIGTLSKEKLAQVIDGSRKVISQNVFD